MAFKAARERITPGDDTIWEVKHVIPGAIVTKTRGTYTVAPESCEQASVVMAKAGYMTPEEAWGLSAIEQCRVWIDYYRARDYETMAGGQNHSPCSGVQHLLAEDIQMVTRKVRWNADFDMRSGSLEIKCTRRRWSDHGRHGAVAHYRRVRKGARFTG